ncbi:MAG: glycerol-3-phosphate 1-O-acyltransferase PlsY [Candidatus Omnitrophota bacterium]|nr:glycerol-3-phosphate 1-O-acyltransferase PlsY [Candidatus Omnitrophota bacterium]
MVLKVILSLLAAYLIGAIPSAYLFARFWKGIDIRKFGSGNVGATNAFRVLGKLPGILVLIVDILKGLICPTLIANFVKIPQMEIWLISLGITAVAGHNWTIFLNFKGGKGMATGLGVLLGLAIKIPSIRVVLALTVGVWMVIFFMFKFVSLASIVAGICLPIFMALFNQPLPFVILGIIFCLFVAVRHKSNISRLLNKEEPQVRLSFLNRKRFL